MSDEFFCVLPWIHIATQTTGNTRVCCISNISKTAFPLESNSPSLSKDSRKILGLNSINEIQNSAELKDVRSHMLEGRVPAACQICKHNELHFGDSKRLNENKIWLSRLGHTPKEPALKYIDLRLGPICNLKCVMCSSDASSSWVTEGKKVYEKSKSPVLKETLRRLHGKETLEQENPNWYKIGSPFWEDFFTHLDDIKEIYFAGGEPLIQKEHQWCLQQIIEKGKAPGIILRYSSNLTYINQEHLDLWKNFSTVQLGVSIDSIGKNNEFIRFPSRWGEFEKNVRKVRTLGEKTSLSFVMTVQALNVVQIKEFFFWSEILENPRKFSSLYFNLLHVPKYLSVKVLPKELKKRARDRYESLKADPMISTSDAYQQWGSIIDFMESEDWSHLWPDFVEYMKILEEVRGISLADYNPEIAAYLS